MDADRDRSPQRMVRNYDKKGGHGGHRAGSAATPEMWEENGGREAVLEAAAERRLEEEAERRRVEEAKKKEVEKSKRRWKEMVEKGKKQKAATEEDAAGPRRSPRKSGEASCSTDLAAPSPAAPARSPKSSGKKPMRDA